MSTFTFVPAGDVPPLPDALDRRIRAECQSVQSAHLSGRKVYWQLRAQSDPDRPLFARALDVDHNGPLYTLCFGPDGRLTPNRLMREVSFPLGSSDPCTPAKDICLRVARDAGEALGLAVVGVNIHRIGQFAVHEDNPIQILIAVADPPLDAASCESQVQSRCVQESANAGITLGSMDVKLEQAKTPQEPSTRPNLSRQSSRTSLNEAAAGLKKRSSRTSLRTPGGTPPRSPLSRRTSANLLTQSRLTSPPIMAPVEPANSPSPTHTISSIAQEFFHRDFASHAERGDSAKLAVILHDSCYGHRYSRPRTSKANLSTIVERPERILAITLGVSAAYVLLGGRYAGSKHAPHPRHSSDTVPFVIRKSTRFVPLTSPAVTNIHGTDWMNELKIMCTDAEAKLTANGKELVRPPNAGVEKPKFHEGDLYLCAESLDAMEGALGAVLDAVDTVFDVSGPKTAFVGIRPPGHHCSADYPAGFCWLNNVHVGISHAAAVHGLTHVAMIDFDLHHGDGSQAITWAHNAAVAALPKNAPFSKRTAIGYFSLHDINSYPCEWGDEEKVQAASLCIEGAHGQTIWNTHLQTWKTDAEFWALYEKRYSVLIDKTRDFFRREYDRLSRMANAPQPRGMIFISAGFDASEWEGQGMQRHKVNVPTEFYERFTKDIMAMSREMGLGVDGRVVSVLEGGYSDRALMSGVMSHLSGMVDHTTKTSPRENVEDFADRMEGLTIGDNQQMQDLGPQAWTPAALDEIDAAVNPMAPPAPKKPRGPVNPTYSTPTQSSTAKVHSSVTARRPSTINEPVYQPTVDELAPLISWAVASQELCKILIPDRQTRSCRPEDLNAEATRVRRNRQSMFGLATESTPQAEDAKPMQLRVRKEKAPPSSKEKVSSRRTTVGGSELAELIGADSTPRAAPKPRRRVSAASTILSTTEEASDPPEPAQRRSRRSSVAATRSSSASGSRAGSAAAQTSRPGSRAGSRAGSPGKARAPRKVIIKKDSGETPSTEKGTATAGPLDTLTEGVKKMSIKLNLPPKPDTEPKKKPVRAPRKTPAATKEKKPAGTPKKPATTPVLKTYVGSNGTSGSPTTLTPTETTTMNMPVPVIQPLPAAATVSSPVQSSPKRPSPSRKRSGTPKATTPRTVTPKSATPKAATPAVISKPIPRADSIKVERKESVTYPEQAQHQSMPPPPSSSTVPAPPSFGMAQPLGQGAMLNQPVAPEGVRRVLPTFTSTSPIPFGIARPPSQSMPAAMSSPPPPENMSPKHEEKATSPIWNIPVTPTSNTSADAGARQQ